MNDGEGSARDYVRIVPDKNEGARTQVKSSVGLTDKIRPLGVMLGAHLPTNADETV